MRQFYKFFIKTIYKIDILCEKILFINRQFYTKICIYKCILKNRNKHQIKNQIKLVSFYFEPS